MVFNDEKLDVLFEEKNNNNIDREDVIHFVTMYGLQSKVSCEENLVVAKFCQKLIAME